MLLSRSKTPDVLTPGTMHRSKPCRPLSAINCQPSDKARPHAEPCSLLSFLSSLNIDVAIMEPHVFPHTDIRSDWLTATRPETYQNLIHSNKDHNPSKPSLKEAEGRGCEERIEPHTPRSRGCEDRSEHTLFSVVEQDHQAKPTARPQPRHHAYRRWWRLSGSNR